MCCRRYSNVRKGLLTQPSAQSRKTQLSAETKIFPGLKSICPNVSGRCKLSSSSQASTRPSRKEASSDLARGVGNGFSCAAIHSPVRSRKGSIHSASFASRKSLHFPSSSSEHFPIEEICSSARLSATRSHAERSAISSSSEPGDSGESQPFQAEWSPRTRGTYLGNKRASDKAIANSCSFGLPVALNQSATPLVSRRMRLNVGLAFNWRNLPVSRTPIGATCSSAHWKSSRSQPALPNGPRFSPVAQEFSSPRASLTALASSTSQQ